MCNYFKKERRTADRIRKMLLTALIALVVFIVGVQLGTSNGRKLAAKETSNALAAARDSESAAWDSYSQLKREHRELQYRLVLGNLEPKGVRTNAPAKREAVKTPVTGADDDAGGAPTVPPASKQ